MISKEHKLHASVWIHGVEYRSRNLCGQTCDIQRWYEHHYRGPGPNAIWNSKYLHPAWDHSLNRYESFMLDPVIVSFTDAFYFNIAQGVLI